MKNQKLSKNVFKNIVIAVFIMFYFILINFAYYKLKDNNAVILLKILSMIILSAGITLLEIAYRLDNGKIALNALETLVFAAHTLSIIHVVELQKLDFSTYILISAYTFSLYYLFKAIFIYTNEKREYLQSLSDIKEIITNQPVKKEAVKRGDKKQ